MYVVIVERYKRKVVHLENEAGTRKKTFNLHTFRSYTKDLFLLQPFLLFTKALLISYSNPFYFLLKPFLFFNKALYIYP